MGLGLLIHARQAKHGLAMSPGILDSTQANQPFPPSFLPSFFPCYLSSNTLLLSINQSPPSPTTASTSQPLPSIFHLLTPLLPRPFSAPTFSPLLSTSLHYSLLNNNTIS